MNSEYSYKNINWFPGHMAKARRLMEEQLKLVDIVIELRDARIPEASGNPLLKELSKNKPVLIILNKADLSDPNIRQQLILSDQMEHYLLVQSAQADAENHQ